MNKNIKVEPMFTLDKLDENLSKNTLNEKSWVVFNLDESNRLSVKFLNEELFKEEFDGFDNFCISVFEDIGSMEHDYKKTDGMNFKSLFAVKSTEDESYDEDLNAVVPVIECSANLVHIYKGGLSLDDLPKIYENMKKEMSNLLSGEIEMKADSAAYAKDPHRYLGISKKDF